MYEERRETVSLKDLILQILLLVCIVLLIIFIIPSKGSLKKFFGKSNKTEQVTKVEASSKDIDELASKHNQVFANNIYTMKEAAVSYYTDGHLPENDGDTDKMTLGEMYEKHLLLNLTDKDGNDCDTENSYVSIVKNKEVYQLKVNLKSGDIEDHIIVDLGKYDYCTSSEVCEKLIESKSDKKSNSNSNNPDDNCKFTIKGNMLTIILNSVGGNDLDSVEFCDSDTCEQKSITIPVPSKEGYKFEGWYADNNYTRLVNITSSNSADLVYLNRYNVFEIYNEDGCGMYTSQTAILYAKWSKASNDELKPDSNRKKYSCEYGKYTGGTWGDYGEWSKWSTQNNFDSSDIIEVQSKTENEVTGYTEEKEVVGNKMETVVVDYNEERYISGYKEEKIQVGTKKVKKQTGTKKTQVKVGTKTEKKLTYQEKKVQVGVKKVVVDHVVRYEKVPVKEKKFVKLGQGTTVPANANGYEYVVYDKKTQNGVTTYYWNVYYVTTVYTTKEVVEDVYGTEPIYEIRKEPVYVDVVVPVYETREEPIYTEVEEPVYETRKTPKYSTRKTPVYETKEVPVYKTVKVPKYSTVTYYRYRVRKYIGGNVETKWSTCDPIDETLTKDGYKLNGNIKKS